MAVEPKDREANLARLAEELDHLKDGLGLLGVKQCSRCGNYFLSADGKNLFDAGQLVCHGCIQDWWQELSPSLSIEERQAMEHKLVRWLVAHHGAKVIRQQEKLPPSDDLALKMVIACDQCDGTGRSPSGGECHNCEGRGSVWVIEIKPELQ